MIKSDSPAAHHPTTNKQREGNSHCGCYTTFCQRSVI